MSSCKHENTEAASAIRNAPVWCPDCKKWVALLDSINNPDSDSKVSTLIDQEPAPSPPPADDGSQAADGAGSDLQEGE